MRGVTGRHGETESTNLISTHTPHAGRDTEAMENCVMLNISTHTPHAGRDTTARILRISSRISTHTPHAGRDVTAFEIYSLCFKFLLTRPMRGVTFFRTAIMIAGRISTHTPHAGRDVVGQCVVRYLCISTHTPHAGRDADPRRVHQGRLHFYSHAPCGA